MRLCLVSSVMFYLQLWRTSIRTACVYMQNARSAILTLVLLTAMDAFLPVLPELKRKISPPTTRKLPDWEH